MSNNLKIESSVMVGRDIGDMASQTLGQRNKALGTQISSLIDSVRSHYLERLELGHTSLVRGRSLGGGGGGGAGAGALPGAEVAAAQDAGLCVNVEHQTYSRSKNRNDGKKDSSSRTEDGYSYSGEGSEQAIESAPVTAKSSADNNHDSSNDEESTLGGEMETLLQMLIALLGTDEVSEVDKNKVMNFLDELKGIIETSEDSELKNDFNQILGDGLAMLMQDNDVDISVIASLESLITPAKQEN